MLQVDHWDFFFFNETGLLFLHSTRRVVSSQKPIGLKIKRGVTSTTFLQQIIYG